jgi:hypothetical protein
MSRDGTRTLERSAGGDQLCEGFVADPCRDLLDLSKGLFLLGEVLVEKLDRVVLAEGWLRRMSAGCRTRAQPARRTFRGYSSTSSLNSWFSPFAAATRDPSDGTRSPGGAGWLRAVEESSTLSTASSSTGRNTSRQVRTEATLRDRA